MKIKKVINEEVILKPTSKSKSKVTNRKLIEDKIALMERLPNLNVEEVKDLANLKLTLTLSKRGRSSKNKGASYERHIACKFKSHYQVELVRTPQSGGFAKKSMKASEFRGDIVPIDKDIDLLLHIECKDQKTWNLKQWIEQSQEDCPSGKIPVVIMKKQNTIQAVGKKGNQQDLVVIDLEHFFSIIDANKILVRNI